MNDNFIHEQAKAILFLKALQETGKITMTESSEEGATFVIEFQAPKEELLESIRFFAPECSDLQEALQVIGHQIQNLEALPQEILREYLGQATEKGEPLSPPKPLFQDGPLLEVDPPVKEESSFDEEQEE